MTINTQQLVDDYYNWLKAKTNWRNIGEWNEITTPYLNRHNDYVQIYVHKVRDGYVLTDDSETITDLIQSGCSLDTPRRQQLLMTTLNGFGVSLAGDALESRASADNFPLRMHNLVQAMLAVNDLFYVARSNVESFFLEDVTLWLDSENIRYSPNIGFQGKSGFPHLFDFLITKSQKSPERILKVINNPNKEYAKATAFAWLDTRDFRPQNASAIAILNDREHKVAPAINEALSNYNITPIIWSERENYTELLAA